LAPEQSAALLDALRTKLNQLWSAEELAAWAAEALGVKNTLTAKDAEALEQIFASKAASLPPPDNEPELTSNNKLPPGVEGEEAPQASDQVEASDRALAIPKPPRRRDKKHLRFVGSQPCLICGRAPSDSHHLRFSQPRALGRKVSDEFTVPLCRSHHRSVHATGTEMKWWDDLGVDPLPIAQKLWAETR
jgi:hypothetical protein